MIAIHAPEKKKSRYLLCLKKPLQKTYSVYIYIYKTGYYITRDNFNTSVIILV